MSEVIVSPQHIKQDKSLKDNFTIETLHQIQSCCMCKQISICICSDLYCRLLTEVLGLRCSSRSSGTEGIQHANRFMAGEGGINSYLLFKCDLYLKAVFHPIPY